MVTTFDDIMRRRIKEHLLNGSLDQVQAAKDFLGYSNQEFGEFLKPLLEQAKEEIPKKEQPKEEPPKKELPKLLEGTVIVQPGGYSIIDAQNQTLHEGGVSEYKTIGFEHGDHIQFKKNDGILYDIKTLYNAVTTGDIPPLHLFEKALVETDYKTGELYIKKDINGNTLKDAGSEIGLFYLRQLAETKKIKHGDIVDLIIKDNGYPHVQWVHRYDYTQPQPKTLPTKTKKATQKSEDSKSNLDFDLTGKTIAIIGLPQNVRQNLIKSFEDEKHIKALNIVDHDINYQTFVTQCTKALKDVDAVVIAKTGLNHAMAGYLVNLLKENNIPFAYANQPSLARVEMATYRAINGLAVDEISYNGDYPTL